MDCKILLTPTEPRLLVVTRVLEEFPIQTIDSPSLDELLDRNYYHYLYPKTFTEAREEPLVVVHTSGTTSVPKPIIHTHDFAASYMQWGQLEAPPGFKSPVSLVQSNCLIVTLPFFHVCISNASRQRNIPSANTVDNLTKARNLYATLSDAIANQTTVITSLAGAPPSAQQVIKCLKHIQGDGIVLAAPLMEQAVKDPQMLDFITSHLDTIAYGGRDVSQTIGNAFASRCKVFNFNGSTETGCYPLLCPSGPYPSKDWKYYCPHPLAGLEFRPSVGGLYEAFIVKNSGFEDEQPVFKILPHLMGYPSKDLFVPHPSKTSLWAYHRRGNDIIVFTPGHLCNPIAMEQQLSNLPEIQVALMAGTGRFQPALLIETESDQAMSESATQNFIQQIWPIIEEANQAYPKDARISRFHILIMDPHKPAQRAGKGTVQRGPTFKLYQDALDALYAKEGDIVANISHR